MTASPYERYVVRRPQGGGSAEAAEGCRPGAAVMMSRELVPEAHIHAEIRWICELPAQSPLPSEEVRGHDRLLLHIGMDHQRPQDLGATVEMLLGGQPIQFHTTTSVFVPRGVAFGPLTWKEFRRPHLLLSIIFEGGAEAPRNPRLLEGEWSPQAPGFDYEKLVIRSPLREAGPEFVTNRQHPTMTYLSRVQIPVVNKYLEFGWIWGVPEPDISRMRHDDSDEVVFHLGSDPANPADLGATMQFGVGGDLLEFDTTHCAYLPRGLEHGPLIWKEVRRPMIEMAMLLGVGTMEEGWANSFFDIPEEQQPGRH